MTNSRYLLIIPCFIITGLIIIAGFWGLADINVKPAQRSLMQWEKDINSLNKRKWSIVYNNVSKALIQNPENPEILTLMANTQEWKIYLDNRDEEKNYYLSLALENYRKAAVLRPALPYTWSHIALVKYRMGEIDQEFQQAIENATSTGPWEPGVHKIIAEVGLSTWKKLDLDLREKVVRNIHRGITMHPIPMLKLLKKYGQLSMVCYQKNNNPVITGYCEKNNLS